jgi:hypothetical protein
LGSSASNHRKADDGKKNEQWNFGRHNFFTLVHGVRTPGKRVTGFPYKEQRGEASAKAHRKSRLGKRLKPGKIQK